MEPINDSPVSVEIADIRDLMDKIGPSNLAADLPYIDLFLGDEHALIYDPSFDHPDLVVPGLTYLVFYYGELCDEFTRCSLNDVLKKVRGGYKDLDKVVIRSTITIFEGVYKDVVSRRTK